MKNSPTKIHFAGRCLVSLAAMTALSGCMSGGHITGWDPKDPVQNQARLEYQAEYRQQLDDEYAKKIAARRVVVSDNNVLQGEDPNTQPVYSPIVGAIMMPLDIVSRGLNGDGPVSGLLDFLGIK